MKNFPGIRNSLEILKLLSDGRKYTLSELHKKYGIEALAKSALLRYLKPLVEEGWVEWEAGGIYSAGPVFRNVSVALKVMPDLCDLIRPFVNNLAEKSGQSSAFVRWCTSGGIRFIAKKEMPDSFHYLELGEVNKGIFSHGFALLALANQSKSDIAHFIKQSGSTEDITVKIEENLNKLSEERFVHSEDKCERYGAPVYYGKKGNFCGVIGVSVLKDVADEAMRVRYKDLVISTALAASNSLKSAL